MDIRLSPAKPEDQVWLERLRRAVNHDLFVATWGGWDEERHLRHCTACWERGNIYIVEFDGKRIGMVQLHEHSDSVELGEIQIHPSNQGQGIGSQLLLDTLRKAHAGGKKVFLRTGLKNLRAVRLYERLGFQHVSQSETHFHMESNPGA